MDSCGGASIIEEAVTRGGPWYFAVSVVSGDFLRGIDE
jgi:hypothetical protein